MTQSWEALRKEARRLETEIETKLIEYSKLASSLQSSSSSRSIDPMRTNEGKQFNYMDFYQSFIRIKQQN